MTISKLMKQVCLTSTVALFGTTAVFAADMGQASGTNVNVRAEASSDAEVLGKIDNGSEYAVLEKSGGWVAISFEGGTGYVSADYFEITEAEGTINGSDINVRRKATTFADSLGKLSDGASVTVTGRNDEWYRISYDGATAYVNKNYVSGENLSLVPKIANEKEEKEQNLNSVFGVVTSSDGVKLRKEASTISKVLTVLPYGTEVDVDRIGSEWIRIVTDGGQKGYVSADYLAVREGERTSRGSASSRGAEVVAYAKQFIGTPYVWGGTNLNKGVDCSGFVYAVMKNFGVSLNRSSYTMVDNGVEVSRSELIAGDLVFFNSGGNSRISHVGIYMGDGTYIHSTDGAAYGVTVTSMNSGYSANTYVTARRVLR